jgi:DNA-binding LacI/PurR family transcriptional regulator
MGALAAETLIDLIQHPSPAPRRLLMPTELVIRESCGAVINRRPL